MKALFIRDINVTNSRIVLGYAEAFAARGVDVQFLELHKIESSETEPTVVVEKLLDTLGVDLVFTAGGPRGLVDSDGRILDNIGRSNLVIYSTIDPRSDEDGELNPAWRSLIELPDTHLFLWEKTVAESLKKSGLERVHYLPLAVNTRSFRPWGGGPGESGEKEAEEVTFVGYPTKARVELLRHLTDFKLTVYGPAELWAGHFKAGDVSGRFRGPVWDEKVLAQAYQRSAVNLNLSRETDVTCVNSAVFSVLGSRGFLITDNRQDASLYFRAGEDLVFYGDPDELRDCISYYLTRAPERDRIAENGCRTVYDTHTYTARAEVMFETIGIDF